MTCYVDAGLAWHHVVEPASLDENIRTLFDDYCDDDGLGMQSVHLAVVMQLIELCLR